MSRLRKFLVKKSTKEAVETAVISESVKVGIGLLGLAAIAAIASVPFLATPVKKINKRIKGLNEPEVVINSRPNNSTHSNYGRQVKPKIRINVEPPRDLFYSGRWDLAEGVKFDFESADVPTIELINKDKQDPKFQVTKTATGATLLSESPVVGVYKTSVNLPNRSMPFDLVYQEEDSFDYMVARKNGLSPRRNLVDGVMHKLPVAESICIPDSFKDLQNEHWMLYALIDVKSNSRVEIVLLDDLVVTLDFNKETISCLQGDKPLIPKFVSPSLTMAAIGGEGTHSLFFGFDGTDLIFGTKLEGSGQVLGRYKVNAMGRKKLQPGITCISGDAFLSGVAQSTFPREFLHSLNIK